MPGTPEPDNFGNDNSGNVALVEITGPGQLPKVEPLRVAGLTWIETDFDFTAVEAARATLTGLLAELRACKALRLSTSTSRAGAEW